LRRAAAPDEPGSDATARVRLVDEAVRVTQAQDVHSRCHHVDMPGRGAPLGERRYGVVRPPCVLLGSSAPTAMTYGSTAGSASSCRLVPSLPAATTTTMPRRHACSAA